jgi:hypothetical protein
LAAFRKGRSHPPKLRSAFGRPEARRAGFGRSYGCGRGSFRLQKSTSGARPSRPQVKSLWTRRRSSFSCESIENAKERRKPAQRWLSRGYGGGFSKEHLSVEGASGCLAALFDEGAGEAVLGLSWPAGDCIPRNWIGSARGQITQPGTRLKTPRQGGIARCGARPSLQQVALCVICPKLDRVVKRAST